MNSETSSGDPLGFADRKPYRERIIDEQKKTGMKDACTVGRGYMRGRPLVFATTDSAFIMGSMGSVVGEKLTRAVEKATELSLPLIIVSGSGGGARTHEGIISLMQMGKVSAALARFRRERTFHFCSDKSYYGRSRGQLRFTRRHHRRGTSGPGGLCWTSSCSGDLQDRPAGRFPDQRIPAEARLLLDRIIHRSEMRSELARLIDYGSR